MLKNLLEQARKHILTALCGTLLTGLATGGVGVYWSLYEAQVNRVEDMKVTEFHTLMSENDKFLEGLSAFTEEIATTGTVDPEKRKALSASLVRLYTGLGSFTVNIPREKEPPVRELQASVNQLRKRVQLVNAIQDLDPLAVAFVKVRNDLKLVEPIFEEAVGKTVAPAT